MSYSNIGSSSLSLSALPSIIKDAFYAITSSCLHSTPTLKINGRTYTITKVLGEGGFSLVYLVKDSESGREFALKKISCPLGSESVREAMREVEATRRFRHKGIIRVLDWAIVSGQGGVSGVGLDEGEENGGKVVYLFLPVYKRGNIQDLINGHLVNGTFIPEQQMVELFKGTCEAVRAMHEFRIPGKSSSSSASSSSRQEHSSSRLSGEQHHDDEDGEEDSVPLMPRSSSYPHDGGAGTEVEGGVLRKGDVEQTPEGRAGELCPYAHRDIKPGNVMLTDSMEAVLMDFGSCQVARQMINTRNEALHAQDTAAVQSTMAYRAPELFDVKTGTELTEAVDVWSLGCTLFAMAYSHSPFEDPRAVAQGGSVAMAVQSGSYKHPREGEGRYSKGLRDLIDSMLILDPTKRPTVSEVVEGCETVLAGLR